MFRKCKLSLPCQLILGIILGIVWGIYGQEYIAFTDWMGVLFLRLLSLLVLPLIFFLLVSSIANTAGGNTLGRLGVKTVVFYVITTLVAILTGLSLASLLRPGEGVDLGLPQNITEMNLLATKRSLSEILIDMVPSNITSAFASDKTFQVVFFSLFLGLVLSKLGEKAKPIREFFTAGREVMLMMTDWIIRLAPLGVFAMISSKLGQFNGDHEQLALAGQSLGLYFITVAGGLFFHFLITLPCMLWCFGLSPLRHLKNMSEVLVTAFSTATSNATIPLSLAALEKKEGVSEQTANFVIPLGATLNMDGTALYECVVVLFIAQGYGMELTLVQMGIIVLTALLSAIGTAGIPMASLVMITLVLNAVGLPLEGLGLVLIVDRPLDMLRTVVNIYGDTCCAVCIAKSEGETLSIDLSHPR